MSKSETEYCFQETTTDNVSTRAPLATGATVLMSLGFAMFAIGIAICYTPMNSDTSDPSVSAHRSGEHVRSQTKTIGEFNNEMRQYCIKELALRPPPQTVVFSRGADFAIYHWRKDCPMFHGLKAPTNFKSMLYMTRQKAEKNGFKFCHYCCELEKKKQTELR